ncbi:hypothetical protein EUX98_g5952 [Antrodiella citrinella]|uniref:Store-operated calcium entry-associated regulatory factor n=1 Tax=Antrodiella citrinella TaxID=2447956 RepID=A0A4S4MQC4_9APHY|nr:hypothetical protein EUX98_g5952 [Antrodiella citrinella]
MEHSKVALARIPSLTFYKGKKTLARRSAPIAQLTCVGKPCRLYTPDVVRCVNAGGSGTDIDWRCEADLPDALRFGRVEVSCEGWSGPGDPYVLKGSCGLEYRLVQVPDALRTGETHSRPAWYSRWTKQALDDPPATIFMIIWVSFLAFILYSLLKSCFRSTTTRAPTPRSNRGSGGGGGGGGGGRGGWFPGGPPTHTDPPPPYSKSSNTTAQADPQGGWTPGFWTGAALGGLGTYLMNRQPQQQRRHPSPPPAVFAERVVRGPFGFSSARVPPTRTDYGDDDRGEGPSNLGQIRRSTGFGGSNVR